MVKKYYRPKINTSSDLNTYKDGLKLGDYPIDCDTCGQRTWYSKITKQHLYTGLGNTIVCKNCVDDIYYGMVPYKVKPEKTVPISRNTIPATTPITGAIDFTRSPPALVITWDTLTKYTWDTWLELWDTNLTE